MGYGVQVGSGFAVGRGVLVGKLVGTVVEVGFFGIDGLVRYRVAEG